MKIQVTESLFRDSFLRVRPEQFSRSALNALYYYYVQIEEDTGEEMELDVVAICCEWDEYPSFAEAAEAYGCKPADFAEQTTVLETDCGIVVQNF